MCLLFLVRLASILVIAVKLEAVTVNPLCPTNKIAPHRRHSRGATKQEGRTFGAFYDLLTPGRPYNQADNPNSQQEKPQNDEPDDCGDIEDYDENDISSVTPKLNRRQGRPFLGPFNLLFQNFHKSSRPPSTTSHPNKQTRPPTGGYFGTNGYRPPREQQPSAHLKPVHEYGGEPHMTYRPSLVGVPNSHIVGVTQVKPFSSKTTTHVPHSSFIYYTRETTPQPYKKYHNSHIKMNRDPTVLGAFIDLLF